MTDNTGFAAFALYNAIKLHFTSDNYDYFKYHGKTNVSKQSFTIRKDKYSFYKLSRRYSLDDLKNFYIANFLSGSGNWVGELMESDAEKRYKEWQKRIQSLTYNFENDILYLLEKYGTSGQEIFQVNDGQHPVLLVEVMRGKVSLETMIILNDVTNFLSMWSSKIKEDIVWPHWKRIIQKYSPFVHYDKNKFKNIVKEKVRENAEA